MRVARTASVVGNTTPCNFRFRAWNCRELNLNRAVPSALCVVPLLTVLKRTRRSTTTFITRCVAGDPDAPDGGVAALLAFALGVFSLLAWSRCYRTLNGLAKPHGHCAINHVCLFTVLARCATP